METWIGNSYHGHIYNPVKLFETTEKTSKKAREIMLHTPYDAFAFRGSSGAAVAFPLSITLKIPCIYVRKPGEQTHGKQVEGPNRMVESYLIIDDFIGSGDTVKSIIKALDIYNLQCVGALLYTRTDEDLIYKKGFVPIPLYGAL